jgi:thiol-disulfide isomerase/thioredoxin
LSVKPLRLHPTRRSIIAAATGLAAAGFWGNCSPAQLSEADLPDAMDVLTQMMPQAAPKLVFRNIKGKQLGLPDYAGHALVVNLWATWCGPCVAELPSFAALSHQLAGSGALVLPISIDMNGADAVRPFYKSHGITSLPILLDPDGTNLEVLNTDGIPVTIILNAAGQMVARMDGAANWNTPGLLKFVKSLTAKPQNQDGFIPV